ncbi:MAG: DegT/DnrJ/EryC1/StrS family aminotransferase [Actinomycetota bacterium]
MKALAVARPEIGEEEVEAAAAVLRSGWLMQGPRTQAFEAAFRDRVGAGFACATSNCTSALHLSLLAVGVRPGDVVVAPTHTFIATANAVRMCGAEPVFADLAPGSPNVGPEQLARLLAEDFAADADGRLVYRHADRLAHGASPLAATAGRRGRLAAILVVHQVGTPSDLAGILPLADRHGIPVIEDAACAAGSLVSLDGGASFEPVGRPRGRLACFSFHPRKIITTGDGGMITGHDPALDAYVRPRREHGMTLGTADRHATGRVVVEDYVDTAFNYRMTDLQAAVGVVQLSRLDAIVAHRRRLGAAYADALAAIDGVAAPAEPAWARTNHQSYVVRLAEPERREAVMLALLAQDIHTRVNVRCCHMEPPYRDLWPAGAFTASERATAEGLILPLNPDMDEADVARVGEALGRALRG